jgi:nucleoside-diphosphate-sugar epimerase
VAVYGGALPDPVTDDTALRPQSSYGAQKAMLELLVSDYARRGLVDGRVLRLPTVSVRPGRPNKAASSFASGIVREPLAGLEAVCPVTAATRVWILSPRRAVEGLVRGHELDAAALGGVRTVNLPGLSVTAAEMVAALGEVAGPAAAARVRWEPDALVQRIVGSWPARWDASRARALGFEADPDFQSVIRAHIADELGGAPASSGAR